MVINGVKADIWPDQIEHATVIVAQCTDVILLHPFAAVIFARQEEQHGCFELCDFFSTWLITRQTASKDAVQSRFIGFTVNHHIQRVVRNFTTVGGKVIHTFVQRGTQIGKAANRSISGSFQALHIVVETCGFNIESFVWTPAW
ncbi:Uncharacterised protein [Yersinia enterocolitica]|nr:Uncharacterised protein [Yersinia enterocolitica]